MQMRRWLIGFAALAMIGLGAGSQASSASAEDEETTRVFELRTYTAAPGKLEALLARFRDHTLALFEKHGMTNVGYWVPADTPGSENTLVYLLAHESHDAAKQSWEEFMKDPDWKAVWAASKVDGPLVLKVESVFLHATDFSAIR
jgi:hypothetical protein